MSGWGPSTSSLASATHLGSVPSMGLTLLGPLPPFPCQGDPLHYKTQPRRSSHLKSPPWHLDVTQGLVPQASCSPTSASFQALCFTGLPGRCTPASPSLALSDAGVNGHATPCTPYHQGPLWTLQCLSVLCTSRRAGRNCQVNIAGDGCPARPCLLPVPLVVSPQPASCTNSLPSPPPGTASRRTHPKKAGSGVV